MFTVRDELSGSEYGTFSVLWSNGLDRSQPKTAQQVSTFGWRNRMTDAHRAWAKANDPMDDTWRPVEVLP